MTTVMMMLQQAPGLTDTYTIPRNLTSILQSMDPEFLSSVLPLPWSHGLLKTSVLIKYLHIYNDITVFSLTSSMVQGGHVTKLIPFHVVNGIHYSLVTLYLYLITVKNILRFHRILKNNKHCARTLFNNTKCHLVSQEKRLLIAKISEGEWYGRKR